MSTRPNSLRELDVVEVVVLNAAERDLGAVAKIIKLANRPVRVDDRKVLYNRGCIVERKGCTSPAGLEGERIPRNGRS